METLLETEGKVTPSCAMSHITYTLYLFEECDDLLIEFDYAPKLLDDHQKACDLLEQKLPRFVEGGLLKQSLTEWETHIPLKNFLSLSFDDQERFRGSAYRREDTVQRFQLAKHGASLGLLKGTIPPGQFRVTISVNSVVTDTCHYTLRVWKGGKSS